MHTTFTKESTKISVFYARHVLNSMDGKANKAVTVYSSSKALNHKRWLPISFVFAFVCHFNGRGGSLQFYYHLFFYRLQWRSYILAQIKIITSQCVNANENLKITKLKLNWIEFSAWTNNSFELTVNQRENQMKWKSNQSICMRQTYLRQYF